MELTEEKVQKAMDKMSFPSPYTAKEWLEHLYLENYHCHKDFSNVCMTDSAESIENYAKRILEYGSGQCLYSGEHGSQGNQFHVYKVAEQYGLKYRHSAEAYWVKDRHEKDRANCHMMIVAKNAEGRKDLNYILSMANIDGYYYKPRIDLDLLFSVNPDNFIVTSACIGGWNYDDAEEIWLKIAKYFGKNFFFEIQYHNTQKQKDLNKRIIDIAQRNNIPIICGLDSHWVLEENRLKRDYMQKDKGIEFDPNEEGWYMDYPDTRTIIQRLEEQEVLTEEQILESILNTNVFVNECEEIAFDRHFKIPNIYKDLDYEGRVKLFKQKINKKYHDDPYKSKEKIEGIKWEVKQLAESGVVDYPLFSEAMVKKAVDEYSGVITRTARGSASSYLTNNYMGLTTIDRFTSEVPLFPERFLTKDRVLAHSLPDVDNNLSEPEPFIQAARDLLGEHGCYPLMTLQTYKEKSAWLMYARVNNVPAGESAALSKDLDKFNKAVKYADEDEIEYIHVEDYISPDYLPLYKKSIPYQGITINVGVHSCGVLIFDGDIRREIGLVTAKSETTGNRTLVAAVEGKYLDEFGYVKEDLLIVDAVSLTKELFDSIGQEVPTFEELKKMVAGDQLTWDIYRKGITCCVNQVEKASTTQKAMRYCPQNIAELCALIAGIRPGFASLINNFLERKPYTTGEEKIDKILEPSSHYMLYQESIMAVLSFLGMPMTETYSVIKAISKKKLKGEKKEKLLKELQEAWFKEFGNMDNFNKVWKVIEDAAAYSFNACLSGETRLKRPSQRPDRYYPTIEEMYKIKNDLEYAKKTDHRSLRNKYRSTGYGVVLSLDQKSERITKNKIVDIRQNGTRDLYRVILSNGSYIDCTLNHKFPLLDGNKRELCELREGDSLLIQGECEKNSDTYRLTNGHFHNNHPKKGECGFRRKPYGNSVLFENKRLTMIEQKKPCEICHKPYSEEERFELHHIDMDRTNNKSSNLKWLCVSCHKKEHYKHGRIKAYGKGIPVKTSEIISIRYLREDMVYDVEVEGPNHTFVTDNGIITSNSHAYAMAGDSLYLAWFKAHHTAKFYETAITHYQDKGNKDKINALMKEAGKFYGYRAGPYEFGADNRRVNVDEENRIIYPNLSAVKGFGEKIVSQIYEASRGTFPDFASVYRAMKTTTINQTQFKNLAKLGYFKAYGNENQILAWIDLHELFSKVNHNITKKKLEENKIPLAYVIPFGRETKSMIKDLNKEELLKDLTEKIETPSPSDYQRMYWQWKIMGIADKTYPDFPSKDMLVTEVDVKKGIALVKLYSPLRGKSTSLKMFTWFYEKHKFVPGDFLTLTEVKNEVIRVPSGRLKSNGKPEYVPIETGETEPWLNKYTVISDSVGLIKNKEKKNAKDNSN